jgi:hypothetical protein
VPDAAELIFVAEIDESLAIMRFRNRGEVGRFGREENEVDG